MTRASLAPTAWRASTMSSAVVSLASTLSHSSTVIRGPPGAASSFNCSPKKMHAPRGGTGVTPRMKASEVATQS